MRKIMMMMAMMCVAVAYAQEDDYDDCDSPHGIVLDLGIGVGTPTNVPDGYGFAPFKSMEWILGLRYTYTPKRSTQTYSTGLWVNWRRYGLSTDRQFNMIPDSYTMEYPHHQVVGLADYPEGASHRSSRIAIFSLSVPVMFAQRFGRNSKFKLTLGPVVNFNLRGRINTSYELGNEDMDISIKDFDYRPVTVDFMGMLTYKGMGMYFKYSPMSVLKTNQGPQFHSLSFGLFL